MSDVWELVHHERVALLRDLAVLDEAQWEVPSLSDGWTVREVAAHLVDNARTTPMRIVVAMALARFNFDRQNAMGVERELGQTAADTLEGLREVAHRRSGPPAPLDSRLVEEVVHGEDIRRPLGVTRSYPVETVERSLRYQARTSVGLGGGKRACGCGPPTRASSSATAPRSTGLPCRSCSWPPDETRRFPTSMDRA